MTRRTLAKRVETGGTALHAGTPVRMALVPAEANTGIRFRRSDLSGIIIPADFRRVAETRLGTVIQAGDIRVGVVEHLMAAVAGAEIDDLEVILDGPEPPILDGDALSYCRLIEEAGIAEWSGGRESIVVQRAVRLAEGGASCALLPSEEREFFFEIDFPTAAIGRQTFAWTFSREGFSREIAPARTFGFVRELEALNRAGLGRGASLENTLAIDGDKVLNASLMRFPDEFVRHKILDAIGDLALAASPIVARFEGSRSGHDLNNRLLRALFADPANYARIPGN